MCGLLQSKIIILFSGFPFDKQNCTLHFIETELMVCINANFNLINILLNFDCYSKLFLGNRDDESSSL